ncbi:phytoene desaturase [Candidatus Bathyarchaeota archaeon]|nr:phytoene desaturase [Candidatus Bathyarchaeota archaeon]
MGKPINNQDINGRKAVVIGAGFAGLASSAYLARHGLKVTLLEKNDRPGGRAMVYKSKGYTFDMGPSWYMMLEAFENIFQLLGTSSGEHYNTIRLDPSYRVFFGPGDFVDISDDVEKNITLFDTFEEGGGAKLQKYLDASKEKYEIAMDNFIYKDYWHFWDFLDKTLIFKGIKLRIFQNLGKYAKRYFNSERARKIMQYHVAFVGAAPPTSPAIYSMLAHCDMNLGIWYPVGGFGSIVSAFENIAKENGVEIKYRAEVKEIEVEDKHARKVISSKGSHDADLVLNTAELPHCEMNLLEDRYQSYPEKYWKKKTIAPATFLIFLGLDKKLDKLEHHNFYFNEDWDRYFDEVFGKNVKWPDDPSMYISVPSRSDESLAPPGGETMTILVLVSPDINDDDNTRDEYYEKIMDLVEKVTGEKIRDSIVVKKVIAHDHFAGTFHAYRGTALGLANTLRQTALFRPHHKSKKVKNLYHAGQYTHPGVGVPVTLISAQLACQKIMKDIEKEG